MSGDNAITNGYQDLINAMPNKKNIIVVIPDDQKISNYSDDFFMKIQIPNVVRKHYDLQISFFSYKLRHVIFKYDITGVFSYLDTFSLIPCMTFLPKNVKTCIYLHDPKLHSRECINNKIKRKINEIFLFPSVDKFIVSYYKGKIMLQNKQLYKNKSIDVVMLPNMPMSEFKYLREKKIKIKYDFIFFGRLEGYKGIDVLLDAFSLPKLSNVKLLIIGSGTLSNYVKNRSDKVNNVTFFNGYMPWEKLAEYICSSRFVIMPYRDATGSQEIAIANYYNKLVLATRAGALGDYIVEGRNGFFINDLKVENLANKINYMYQLDENKYVDFIKEEYKKFDINKIAKQIYDIISK